MTAVVRDAWSDAHAAATQAVLDRDAAAVHRRVWVKRAVTLVVGLLVLLGAYAVLDAALGHSTDTLWDPSLHVIWAGFGLAGVGLLLMVAGSLRVAGLWKDRTFVGPDAFLSRADRRWVRARIAGVDAVPDERRDVVAAVARRMIAESRYGPGYGGLICLYVGMLVAAPMPTLVVGFAALTAWSLVRIVRNAVWARRARRWLAANA